MEYSSKKEERKLWKRGCCFVVGLDEAGRGPIAGPVVAAAVAMRSQEDGTEGIRLRDSKKLSASQREKNYKIITTSPVMIWGVGRVSEKTIDKINILEAAKLAMVRAVDNLKTKSGKRKIDFLILDGRMELDLPIPQKSIVKGDEKVFSCAAASIIAKVTRDRLMEKYHRQYPCYGFDRHKGYPTRYHVRMLKRHGACKIHRKTFAPVKRLDFKN
jgi:ribonuclease HII